MSVELGLTVEQLSERWSIYGSEELLERMKNKIIEMVLLKNSKHEWLTEPVEYRWDCVAAYQAIVISMRKDYLQGSANQHLVIRRVDNEWTSIRYHEGKQLHFHITLLTKMLGTYVGDDVRDKCRFDLDI